MEVGNITKAAIFKTTSYSKFSKICWIASEAVARLQLY